MTKPNNFILATDFASLKNDNRGSVNLAITSASPALSLGQTYTYSNTITLGTINASIRCQLRTSLASTVIYSSPQMQITLRATTAGSEYDYPTTVYVERTSPTVITIKCHIYGSVPGQTVQITGGFQTITADIVTFLSPFN